MKFYSIRHKLQDDCNSHEIVKRNLACLIANISKQNKVNFYYKVLDSEELPTDLVGADVRALSVAVNEVTTDFLEKLMKGDDCYALISDDLSLFFFFSFDGYIHVGLKAMKYGFDVYLDKFGFSGKFLSQTSSKLEIPNTYDVFSSHLRL